MVQVGVGLLIWVEFSLIWHLAHAPWKSFKSINGQPFGRIAKLYCTTESSVTIRIISIQSAARSSALTVIVYHQIEALVSALKSQKKMRDFTPARLAVVSPVTLNLRAIKCDVAASGAGTRGRSWLADPQLDGNFLEP